MNNEAYGITVFCDDIRHEIAGKMTLVGCYLAEMNFNEPAPGLLPTFAALVNIRIPIALEFSKITLRVTKETDGEVEEIFKADVDVPSEDKEKIKAGKPDVIDGSRLAIVTFPIRWSPLEFRKPGFIKVRGYLDDEVEIKAGALKVNFPTKEGGDDQPSKLEDSSVQD
ncbi:MAG: hypothetical protein NXH84_03865 [Rhodobacteraceae bacterium]|nr:hypothetical protein [Paracoccaceae bacterium]